MKFSKWYRTKKKFHTKKYIQHWKYFFFFFTARSERTNVNKKNQKTLMLFFSWPKKIYTRKLNKTKSKNMNICLESEMNGFHWSHISFFLNFVNIFVDYDYSYKKNYSFLSLFNVLFLVFFFGFWMLLLSFLYTSFMRSQLRSFNSLYNFLLFFYAINS